MDIEKCLEILSERQKQPMNKAEDMPDIEGLELEGQAHVFEQAFLEGEEKSKDTHALSFVSTGKKREPRGVE